MKTIDNNKCDNIGQHFYIFVSRNRENQRRNINTSKQTVLLCKLYCYHEHFFFLLSLLLLIKKKFLFFKVNFKNKN